MKKKIIAAALAAAVLLAAGGLLFGLHRIGETTISAGPEPAAPEEVQPAEPEEPTTKVCPYCQSEISIKAVRCPHCTSKLEGFPEMKA